MAKRKKKKIEGFVVVLNISNMLRRQNRETFGLKKAVQVHSSKKGTKGYNRKRDCQIPED